MPRPFHVVFPELCHASHRIADYIAPTVPTRRRKSRLQIIDDTEGFSASYPLQMCPNLPYQTLAGFHKRAITALSFSPNGRELASLGCDDDHSIAVYDWKNRLLRVSRLTAKYRCLSLLFDATAKFTRSSQQEHNLAPKIQSEKNMTRTWNSVFAICISSCV